MAAWLVEARRASSSCDSPDRRRAMRMRCREKFSGVTVLSYRYRYGAQDHLPARPARGGHNGGMQPVAVHHVSINVDDVEAAVRFYTDVLGLAQRGDRP